MQDAFVLFIFMLPVIIYVIALVVYSRTIFVPWDDVEITARRSRYEYEAPVILRFRKTPEVAVHVTQAVMDKMLALGIPFHLADDGTLIRNELQINSAPA